MIQAAKATTHVLLLAAVCLPAFANIPRSSLVAEKPHQGSVSFALASHRAESVANALNAPGIAGCLYDSGTRPCCSGKERDAETGLDYLTHRYLSPAQGRFTSPDPQNAGARQDEPQSWNGYSYAANNPLRFTDPFGLDYHVCDAAGNNCRDLTQNQYDHYLQSIKGSNIYVTPGGTINAQNDDGSVTKIGSASYFDEKAAQRAENAVGFLNFAVTTMASNYLQLAGPMFQAFRASGPLVSIGASEAGNAYKAVKIWQAALQRWKSIPDAQKILLDKWLGSVKGSGGVPGPIPPGLSRETAAAYLDVAKAAGAAGRDGVGSQAARIPIVEKFLSGGH